MSEIFLSRRVNKHVPKNRWIASLSNGETIFEDYRKGEKAAWVRLSQYVIENGLAITYMRAEIGGLVWDSPANQEGYVQKKRVTSTGAWTSKMLCVGHVQGGLALIHYLGPDRSSQSTRCADPGHPFTIYRHDIECHRECCNAIAESE